MPWWVGDRVSNDRGGGPQVGETFFALRWRCRLHHHDIALVILRCFMSDASRLGRPWMNGRRRRYFIQRSSDGKRSKFIIPDVEERLSHVRRREKQKTARRGKGQDVYYSNSVTCDGYRRMRDRHEEKTYQTNVLCLCWGSIVYKVYELLN